MRRRYRRTAAMAPARVRRILAALNQWSLAKKVACPSSLTATASPLVSDRTGGSVLRSLNAFPTRTSSLFSAAQSLLRAQARMVRLPLATPAPPLPRSCRLLHHVKTRRLEATLLTNLCQHRRQRCVVRSCGPCDLKIYMTIQSEVNGVLPEQPVNKLPLSFAAAATAVPDAPKEVSVSA